MHTFRLIGNTWYTGYWYTRTRGDHTETAWWHVAGFSSEIHAAALAAVLNGGGALGDVDTLLNSDKRVNR